METLPIPYKTNLSLPANSSVKIKGKPVMPFCMFPEMEVDFLTKTEVDSDITFKIQVCFGKEVVMNSRKNGTWGQEVKSTDMPFKDGQPFNMDILVLSDQYRHPLLVLPCSGPFPNLSRSRSAPVPYSPGWRSSRLHAQPHFYLCCHSFSFHVTVNGVQCYTFPHRIDPGSVKMMQVWRDVSLTSVTTP
ncbi:galectin-10-like isoform X2 [Myotis lucifugus]|uniref:galectin-10-like isoform X2 n=1 Tax=Myotis lucifugus TaxID=59463 RepID=UPI000CCC6056|nr:galectin-10-like isoform X2 [Myotis lucifugus]